VVEGTPRVGDSTTAEVDAARRTDIMRNHTATHLLHAQLRAVLGSHVQQRGSLVAPDRLRFDFSHDAPVTPDELTRIGTAINAAILDDMPILIVEKDLATARSEGAMALFGEKYGERVRTVRVCEEADHCDHPYSYELCGGTHVKSTGKIGSIVITVETSVGQGIRRIEALTGTGAQQYVEHQLHTLQTAAGVLNTRAEQLPERIEALREELGSARRESERLRRQVARLAFEKLYDTRQAIDGAEVLIAHVEPTAPETLREMADWFRDKTKSGVIALGMVADGKPFLLAAVTEDLTKRLHAGNLIKAIAPTVGGGGGGRPNLAQAGGKNPDQLDAALNQAREWIEKQLKA
jgi:alanyl-tRNA synthetase